MSETYGPVHKWFAWRPVDTNDQGWKWLRTVYRRRTYLDIADHPAQRFWDYSMTVRAKPSEESL
ncbi:hypothetical protein [Rhodococcus sp. NPDC055024]